LPSSSAMSHAYRRYTRGTPKLVYRTVSNTRAPATLGFPGDGGDPSPLALPPPPADSELIKDTTSPRRLWMQYTVSCLIRVQEVPN